MHWCQVVTLGNKKESVSMNLANMIKEIPKKKDVSISDLMDLINTVMSIIVETPINEPIEVNDWIIFKVDNYTFKIQHRYTPADMSRFMHDEFSKKRLIKIVDKL